MLAFGIVILAGTFIPALKKVLVKINQHAHKLMLIIGQISLVLMIVIVTMTVVMRLLGTGLSWAEEVPRMLITLFVFIACSIGVRDHMHVSVNIIYNLFPKEGNVRKVLIVLTDVAILLCGLFMLFSGAERCIKMFGMSGSMPITGISTAWQYLPIPIGGFMVSVDSWMFLCGILKRDDYLYSDPDSDSDDAIIEKARDEMKEREANA